MAKKEKYNVGTQFEIEIGGLPNLSYISQPRNVETHIFTTPPLPKKSEILFSDLPKKEQYWRRTVYPQLFYDYVPGVTKVTEEEHKMLTDCLKKDLDRRANGLFFMNDGVPVFITGNNYFFLQWGDMQKGNPGPDGHSYPSYRRFQRDFYYFVDIVIKDDNCLGGFVSKAKKLGMTQMMSAMFANEATLYEKIRCGVMSKTFSEAVKTNFSMIKHIIRNMPQIILPKLGKETNSELMFSHPPSKATGTKQYYEKQQKMKEESVLDSVIETVVTKVGSFDGAFYRHIHFDEFSKYWQSNHVSPKEEFDKDSASVKLQQQIKGKVWITAYNPEVDDRGFLEARTIFYDSEKSTINQNHTLKRTKSGLFCYHISALYATEGTFDIFGNADIAHAYKLNDEERQSAAGDVNKLQALIRQGSRTSDESWNIGGGGGSIWNNGKIQESINEKDRLEFMKIPYKVRGNLYYVGEPMKSPVRFRPDPAGRWYMTKLIDESLLNGWSLPDDGKKNKYGYQTIIPNQTVNFVGSLDPSEYKYVDEDGVKGASKNSSHTMALPNPVMDSYYKNLNPNDSFSKRVISWYCERPLNPNDFIDDFIMEILYFGKRVLVEDNKAAIVTLLKDRGMTEFLLFQNNDTGEIEMYNPNGKQKEKSTQTGTVETICRKITEYFTQMPGQPDLLFLCEDVEFLTQCMRFDPFNTKPFHKVMSFGYVLMALDSFSVMKKKKNYENLDMASLCRALAS